MQTNPPRKDFVITGMKQDHVVSDSPVSMIIRRIQIMLQENHEKLQMIKAIINQMINHLLNLSLKIIAHKIKMVQGPTKERTIISLNQTK